MSTYKVRCAWDDGAWVVTTVPKRRGIHTQAKRLDQVPGRVAEAAHLMTGEALDAIRVEIVEFAGSPVIDRALAVRSHRHAAAEATRAAEADTEALIGPLRQAGFPYRDIGALLGISHQRAHQLVADPTPAQ